MTSFVIIKIIINKYSNHKFWWWKNDFKMILNYSYIPKKANPPANRYIILNLAPLNNPFIPSSSIIYIKTALIFVDFYYVIIFVFKTSNGVTMKPATDPAIDPLRAIWIPPSFTSSSGIFYFLLANFIWETFRIS